MSAITRDIIKDSRSIIEVETGNYQKMKKTGDDFWRLILIDKLLPTSPALFAGLRLKGRFFYVFSSTGVPQKGKEE